MKYKLLTGPARLDRTVRVDREATYRRARVCFGLWEVQPPTGDRGQKGVTFLGWVLTGKRGSREPSNLMMVTCS